MDLFVFGSTVAAATLWLRRRRPIKERRISHVSSKNTLVEEPTGWCRATYILVMHEPPHLFYEPKEWSHTSVLLLKTAGGQLELPGGNVWQGETYEESAVRQLIQDARIDVCRPENCLHHLFTFPFEFQGKEQHCAIWGDFYECVFRGKIQDLSRPDAVCMSLAEIKDLLEDTSTPKEPFLPDTEYALQLYFQRQGDLRAKRRLLKG